MRASGSDRVVLVPGMRQGTREMSMRITLTDSSGVKLFLGEADAIPREGELVRFPSGYRRVICVTWAPEGFQLVADVLVSEVQI